MPTSDIAFQAGVVRRSDLVLLFNRCVIGVWVRIGFGQYVLFQARYDINRRLQRPYVHHRARQDTLGAPNTTTLLFCTLQLCDVRYHALRAVELRR